MIKEDSTHTKNGTTRVVPFFLHLHWDNDKPARIITPGHEEYWIHGKRHRDLGPAIIRNNSVDSWYKN